MQQIIINKELVEKALLIIETHFIEEEFCGELREAMYDGEKHLQEKIKELLVVQDNQVY